MLSTAEIKKRIYCRPLTKGHPASPYASDHGCDWTCREAPVYAIAAGKVYKIYNKGAKRNPNATGTPSWGQYVVIDHGGWCSGYAHLKDFNVKEGDTVKAGQRFATSGNTGRTLGNTGMHLHLDIYQSSAMGNRWKSPFGIKGLFYNAPAIRWADGSVGDEDYTPDGGYSPSDGTEGGTQQGVDFSKAAETLISSANWKWVSDIEKEPKVEYQHGPTLDAITKSMSDAFSTWNTAHKDVGDTIISKIYQDPKFIESKYSKVKEQIKTGSAKGMPLTQYPSFVEAPVINISFNGNIIGTFNNVGDKYPNYVTSINVNKINGRINQYTIQLQYTIRPGDDPNFIDSLISSVGLTKPIKILYGDSANPALLYKEESAYITGVTMNEGVSSNSVNYTITAISSLASALTATSNYSTKTDKPSNIIRDLIKSNKYIRETFPKMLDANFVSRNNLIPTDDIKIKVGGMMDTDIITYLNYLVVCMQSSTKGSTYTINYSSDYFKISKVSSSSNFYEVDVGFPSSMVMDFSLNENVYWPAVYDYNAKIPGQWDYTMTNAGDIIKKQCLNLTKNPVYGTTTHLDEQYWKQITEYPISANLTIKGLIKPAMLGEYVKVNTVFYGQEDLGSGLYIVTAQKDTLTSGGYRTTLELLRVGDSTKIYG